MVRNAGVFDYLDRSPPDDEFRDLLKASEEFDIPILGSGWFYTVGRDEHLYEQNIIKARLLGSLVHNVQLLTQHADGHLLRNQEIAEIYLRFHDFAERHGVAVCFEVHVNMWSEHFGRVGEVAALVEQRGVPFVITLDHSHVIFKIDNPEELEVQGLRKDVEAGTIILERTDQATSASSGSRPAGSAIVMRVRLSPTIPSTHARRIQTVVSEEGYNILLLNQAMANCITAGTRRVSSPGSPSSVR